MVCDIWYVICVYMVLCYYVLDYSETIFKIIVTIILQNVSKVCLLDTYRGFSILLVSFHFNQKSLNWRKLWAIRCKVESLEQSRKWLPCMCERQSHMQGSHFLLCSRQKHKKLQETNRLHKAVGEIIQVKRQLVEMDLRRSHRDSNTCFLAVIK